MLFRSNKETIGDTLDDAWIHTKIVAKLIANSTTPERKINVDVVKNVVTLRGAVDSAEERAAAEKVAKETDGVKSATVSLDKGSATVTYDDAKVKSDPLVKVIEKEGYKAEPQQRKGGS